jgi:hypothetical protein
MTVAVEKYTLPTDVLIRLNKAKTRFFSKDSDKGFDKGLC